MVNFEEVGFVVSAFSFCNSGDLGVQYDRSQSTSAKAHACEDKHCESVQGASRG
jgi:hypothetical protein